MYNIHGASRPARSARRTAPLRTRRFGDESTSAWYWGGKETDEGETLFWSNTRWATGGTNTNPPQGFSTSFDLLDALIAAMPSDVPLVSINGYSAGGQLTGRYAFATALGTPGASRGPHVRFFVGNPGSYLCAWC